MRRGTSASRRLTCLAQVRERGSERRRAVPPSARPPPRFAGTYRSLWETYYRDVNAIIFVVDSTDKIRMCVAKDELDSMLAHRDIAGSRIPILFYANKMDLPTAMEPTDVMSMLGLAAISDMPWHIQVRRLVMLALAPAAPADPTATLSPAWHHRRQAML